MRTVPAPTPDVPLRTERLILRHWRPADREPFAALNADPVVMQYFPSTRSREESDATADRIDAVLAEHGFGLWAVEVPGVAPFIGFVGLSVPSFTAPFTPCVEIGWRLARPYWGHGYATEAAEASLAVGFTSFGLDEIVAFTVPANAPSRAVMDRIGMTSDPTSDFDHPQVPEGHPRRRHMLYRLSRARWQERRAAAP